MQCPEISIAASFCCCMDFVLIRYCVSSTISAVLLSQESGPNFISHGGISNITEASFPGSDKRTSFPSIQFLTATNEITSLCLWQLVLRTIYCPQMCFFHSYDHLMDASFMKVQRESYLQKNCGSMTFSSFRIKRLKKQGIMDSVALLQKSGFMVTACDQLTQTRGECPLVTIWQ